MPCNSGQGAYGGDDYEARRMARDAKAEADKVTRLLCSLLRSFPDNVIEALDPEVRDWFKAHRAHDAAEGRP